MTTEGADPSDMIQPASAPSRPRRSHTPAILVAVAIMVASMVTWRTSSVLFTATTSNGPQSFSTGSVTLTDNDLGVALFSVTNMKPGATGQQCIKVTYGGTLAATIKVYGTGLTATNALDTYLNIQIEEGSTSATTFPSCSGFTASGTIFNAALSTLGTNYSGGVGTWAPSGSAAKDYRITYTLSSAAPNSTQSSTAAVTFTWEAQNS